MGRVKKTNDKRDRIMNAAISSFAQHGYHQATIADVAREAGVAAGTIYLEQVKFYPKRSSPFW